MFLSVEFYGHYKCFVNGRKSNISNAFCNPYINSRSLATPFCLILLSGEVEDEKFESVIFHNINSKGEHLTSEENLKALLNDDYFSDEEVTQNFSWSYVKARQLVKRLEFDYLQGIKNSLPILAILPIFMFEQLLLMLSSFLRIKSL
jgi:hypothetical protein